VEPLEGSHVGRTGHGVLMSCHHERTVILIATQRLEHERYTPSA